MRPSEVLQITVAMVREGILQVCQKGNRPRSIHLPPQCQESLLEFIEYHRITGHVFKSRYGHIIDRVQAFRHVKNATGYTCHSFRKAAIEIMAASGVHPLEIAKVSGHSCLNMVFYYDNSKEIASGQNVLAGVIFGTGL